MKILALEFSSPSRSVAVVEGAGQGTARVLSEVVELDTGARATPALGWIDQALREGRLEREEVECLALGLGPGSYTGIRAAIAVAQGWQLAAPGVRLLGLSSADGIAAQAQAQGMTGRVVVVINAQRQEFYLAEYELMAAGWHAVTPLRLAALAEVQQRERAGELLIGPDVAAWFPGVRVLFPSAAMLGRLVVGRTDFVPGEKLEPIYLRETTFVKAAPPRSGAC